LLVGFRVDDVEHDAAAVAARIDAVELHEEERVPRQVAKVDRRDGAALVLGLLGEEEVEGHHAHGAFLVQLVGGWRSKDGGFFSGEHLVKMTFHPFLATHAAAKMSPISAGSTCSSDTLTLLAYSAARPARSRGLGARSRMRA